MGVKGAVGAGTSRRPNQTAYFVALAGILLLILLLCCYFLYFCITKVKELSQQETPTAHTACQPTRAPACAVQPEVRDTATAMARLCKQLPSSGKSAVFPAPAEGQGPYGDASDYGQGGDGARDYGQCSDGRTQGSDSGKLPPVNAMFISETVAR